MIKNKSVLIISAILFCICICLYFPFPNNNSGNSLVAFMFLPIKNADGYIMYGIIGTILLIIALILLIIGIKKYYFRQFFPS